jgi:hypothetical protein
LCLLEFGEVFQKYEFGVKETEISLSPTPYQAKKTPSPHSPPQPTLHAKKIKNPSWGVSPLTLYQPNPYERKNKNWQLPKHGKDKHNPTNKDKDQHK